MPIEKICSALPAQRGYIHVSSVGFAPRVPSSLWSVESKSVSEIVRETQRPICAGEASAA